MDTTLHWPFLVYAGAALGVIAGMLGVSYVLGQRHTERETGEPFESGILQTGSGRLRLSIQFCLVGLVYEYKSGALDFDRKKPQTSREESYENSTADTR